MSSQNERLPAKVETKILRGAPKLMRDNAPLLSAFLPIYFQIVLTCDPDRQESWTAPRRQSNGFV